MADNSPLLENLSRSTRVVSMQDIEPQSQETLRDDSSAREYAKTSHLAKRYPADMQNQLNGMTSVEKAQVLHAAANEDYDAMSDLQRARALTADNLQRVPDADQLAPGIRLPGRQLIDSRRTEDTDMDVLTSSDADEAAHSLETCQTSVGAFGEGGAPVLGVPPELDPRTSTFRPHSPTAASVFSVAVQPPASPKPSIMDPSEPTSPYVEPFSARDRSSMAVGSASATAGSSYSASARGSSPPLSAGFTPSEPYGAGGRWGGPRPSALSRTFVSVAPSEDGSIESAGTSGAQASTGTVDDQELSLRAAYIERQRMRERELLGGEAGVGGMSIPNFPVLPARVSTPLASKTGDQVSRAGSTAATIGTTSPPASLSGSEIPDAVANSRRGSVDSTETLASVRAPPSISGFDLTGGESRRRSRRASSSVGHENWDYLGPTMAPTATATATVPLLPSTMATTTTITTPTTSVLLSSSGSFSTRPSDVELIPSTPMDEDEQPSYIPS